MRNIKDLKPTEQILVTTDKEAKKIKKLVSMGWSCVKAPFYFRQSETGTSKTIDPHRLGGLTVLPASDFLPKKNKVKKRLKALEAKVDELMAKECVVSEAEQVKEQPAEIDWSKPGQYVQSTLNNWIGITTGYDNGTHSSVVYIMPFCVDKAASVFKGNFRLYKGKLTLCNE